LIITAVTNENVLGIAAVACHYGASALRKACMVTIAKVRTEKHLEEGAFFFFFALF